LPIYYIGKGCDNRVEYHFTEYCLNNINENSYKNEITKSIISETENNPEYVFLEEEEFNDKRLFVIVCVIALCGVVKSLIRHFKLRWLPEAGGCILVGMVGGLFLRFLPNMDFGFQHDMFLRLMVPPIGKAMNIFFFFFLFRDVGMYGMRACIRNHHGVSPLSFIHDLKTFLNTQCLRQR
jgi:hypothetical protein